MDEDDDDWEHISGVGHGNRDVQAGLDDGDIILLGEMELEDAVNSDAGYKSKGVRGAKSYAAVVGATS